MIYSNRSITQILSRALTTAKSCLLFSCLSILSFGISAQIEDGDKIYLEFLDTQGEVNVNGRDACDMLKDYVRTYTDLNVVFEKEESDFTFVLSVYEKNMGNRRGKFDVFDSKSNELIYGTGWQKGFMMVWYDMSGTKHVIARTFIDEFLEEYPRLNRE